MTAIKKAFMLPERNRNDFRPPPCALWATVPSDELPGGAQSKLGTRAGRDGWRPGSSLHLSPEADCLNAFYQALGCGGGCAWGAVVMQKLGF